MTKLAHVLADQTQDGGFKYYVTFGNKSPINADECDVVECATEEDAHKLAVIVSGIY